MAWALVQSVPVQLSQRTSLGSAPPKGWLDIVLGSRDDWSLPRPCLSPWCLDCGLFNVWRPVREKHSPLLIE